MYRRDNPDANDPIDRSTVARLWKFVHSRSVGRASERAPVSIFFPLYLLSTNGAEHRAMSQHTYTTFNHASENRRNI